MREPHFSQKTRKMGHPVHSTNLTTMERPASSPVQAERSSAVFQKAAIRSWPLFRPGAGVPPALRSRGRGRRSLGQDLSDAANLGAYAFEFFFDVFVAAIDVVHAIDD
jgi:hypothetical protein